MQTSLFETPSIESTISGNKSKTLNDLALLSKVKGLVYIPEYITKDEQTSFWQSVNSENWLGDLKRRVQHYGYKYDYKSRFIDYSMKIGELPFWALPIANKLHEDNYMRPGPDQLIVNEYKPGQGIASHVDCEPCFGGTIVSLSLGSTCVMNFINKQTKERIDILLEPRSLVILNDDARYLWTHGITGKKSDIFKGHKYERETRISLTFRKVKFISCEI